MHKRIRLCVCDYAVLIGGRKNYVGGYECSMHRLYTYWNRIFSYVSKIKRGMPAVSSMIMPLRVYNYMLRIYSAVILVLAINSLKIKQIVDFFCFAVVVLLHAELILK